MGMTPLVSHTQIPITTQLSMVATTMPNAMGAVHAAPSAVAPSVASDKIVPDAKGNGIYTAPVSAAAAVSPLASPLSVLIPANFSTNAASLSASSIYAAQALSQDPNVYETMQAASEVKYMPSKATAPEPAPNNLFAKMLAEEQSHTQQASRSIQQVASAPVQTAQAQAPAPKPAAPAPRKSEMAANNNSASVRSIATHAYSTTNSRNSAQLGEAKVEEVPEVPSA